MSEEEKQIPKKLIHIFWAHDVSFEKRGTEVHLSEEEKYCNIFFVSSVNDLDL